MNWGAEYIIAEAQRLPKMNNRLHIIYDDRRFERLDLLKGEMLNQGIVDYELIPCIPRPKVVESINESHRAIVQMAKDKGLTRVIIGEDDLQFSCVGAWEWFLFNEPPLYDIYAGGNYMAFERPKNKGAFRVSDIVGFHLYMVHSRYYDTFLSTNPTQHIDTAQKSPLMYVCYPFPALQREGYSANNGAKVNYNTILQPEDIYQP